MKVLANDKGDTIDLSLDRVSAAILLEIVESYDPDDYDSTSDAKDELRTVRNAVYAELYRTSGV